MNYLFKKFDLNRSQSPFNYFIWLAIAVGILLRVAVYMQANNMYMDEADIARNIFGRSFAGLTQPLSYYQYAPPVFLWFIKASTLIGGYSEYAYRLYPLLCGIAALFVMYKVLKHFVNSTGIWYVILLLAAGPIYVRYSCVTKQYMPDMLIALLLLWLALTQTPLKNNGARLFTMWAIAGSVAIWSSMPSVFILAGIGCYYLAGMFKQKDFSKIWFLIAAGALWLGQFGLYYLLMLKPQANSPYLQHFHEGFFFYAPVSTKMLLFDINLLLYFISNMGGHQVLAWVFHIACIAIGVWCLARRDAGKLLLITVPVMLLLLAAALHQYSMIQRLLLFAMPLLLVLLARGLQQLLSVRYVIVHVTVWVVAVICILNFNALKYFVRPMQMEQITDSFTYLNQQGISGNHLYVDHLAEPAYVYYTNIHPQKNRYRQLLDAEIMPWGTNFDSLSQTFIKPAAVLYSWDEPSTIAAQQAIIKQHRSLRDSNVVMGSKVYIYD